MPEYLNLEVELRGVDARIWRRFMLPASVTFWDLHLAVVDACDWGDQQPSYFHVEGDESSPIAGMYYDEPGTHCREDLFDLAAVLIAEHLRAPGDRVGFNYGCWREWKHLITVCWAESRDESVPRLLLGGARAFPYEGCGGVTDYEYCVKRIGEEGGLDELVARFGRTIRRWRPERFDLAKEKRSFDRGAFIVISKEEMALRFERRRAMEAFRLEVEARPVGEFGMSLIAANTSRGSRRPWRTLVSCGACRSDDPSLALFTWIDAAESTISWRCPGCGRTGTVCDIAGQPVVVPDVEDITQRDDLVNVDLSWDDYVVLLQLYASTGGATYEICGAEQTSKGVRISGGAERMGEMLAFLEDRTDHASGEHLDRLLLIVDELAVAL